MNTVTTERTKAMNNLALNSRSSSFQKSEEDALLKAEFDILRGFYGVKSAVASMVSKGQGQTLKRLIGSSSDVESFLSDDFS